MNIFTITTVTVTVNEELLQKVPHEAQLSKNNSPGFPSVLLHAFEWSACYYIFTDSRSAKYRGILEAHAMYQTQGINRF